MKKLFFSFAALTFLITTAFTGGESCNGNDFFHEGTKSKMGYYSADGKQTGSGTSEVKKVYTSGDSTIAVLNSTYTDMKNSEPHTSEIKFACVNGLFVMDMSGAMNAAMPGHSLKMISRGNMVAYKQSYAVGEKLDSVSMTMDTYNNGALMMTTHVRIYDRVVESYQDLKVPAGIFKCYKISYYSSGTTEMHGKTFPANKPTKSVIYYCPKTGMVRMETFGADDKLFSYSELLELTKP
jgi:hypothetical protein